MRVIVSFLGGVLVGVLAYIYIYHRVYSIPSSNITSTNVISTTNITIRTNFVKISIPSYQDIFLTNFITNFEIQTIQNIEVEKEFRKFFIIQGISYPLGLELGAGYTFHSWALFTSLHFSQQSFSIKVGVIIYF